MGSNEKDRGLPRSFCCLQPDALRLNLAFHHKVRWSEPRALEKQVKIGPLEHQFGHVVHLCILEQIQRTNSRKGVLSGQWFGVVVEVDDIGFPEA
jgi:hypothetical protein